MKFSEIVENDRMKIYPEMIFRLNDKPVLNRDAGKLMYKGFDADRIDEKRWAVFHDVIPAPAHATPEMYASADLSFLEDCKPVDETVLLSPDWKEQLKKEMAP